MNRSSGTGFSPMAKISTSFYTEKNLLERRENLFGMVERWLCIKDRKWVYGNDCIENTANFLQYIIVSAAPASHVLSFHHLISYFIIDVISVTTNDTIIAFAEKYSKYQRISILPTSSQLKKQLKKNVSWKSPVTYQRVGILINTRPS